MDPSKFIFPEWLKDEVRYLSLLKTARHASNRGGGYTQAEVVKRLADAVLDEAASRGIVVDENGDPLS